MSRVIGNMVVRRAEFDDNKALAALVQDTGGIPLYRATFNVFNFSLIIENSFISMIATSNTRASDSDEQPVIGFMAANDSLPLFSEPAASKKVLQAINIYIPVTETNALFLNFWMVNEVMKGTSDPGLEMVKALLAACPNIDYILWVCPRSFALSDYTSHFFAKLKIDVTEDKILSILENYQVFVLTRSNFLPKLMVREARVEDNDDLIPILQNSNPDILVGQESYFLADLIRSQDANNSFYVGLQKNSIVGMLATSLDVNVSLIMKIFDIESYPDIIIKKEERPPPPPLLITIVGDLRLLETASVQDAVSLLGCVFINAETMELALPAASTTPTAAVAERKTESKSPRFEGKEDDADMKSDDSSSIMAALKSFIEKTLTRHQSELAAAGATASNLVPPAIVLFGYPRNESEAMIGYDKIVHDFDYIIEIHNSAEDAEDDEEDDFLQQHLDALEVLREQYFANEGKAAGGSHHHHHHHHNHRHLNEDGSRKASWRKVSVDGEAHSPAENLRTFSAELDKIVEHRVMKIEAQRAKDNAEPPKANAFAVTVFCLTDDFQSRGTDLLKMAFEDYSHHDYCLFMVPNNNPPSSDLLRSLNLVQTRPGVSFDQSLYVMHRSAFLIGDHLHVQRVIKNSISAVEEYAQKLSVSDRAVLKSAANSALAEIDVDLYDNPKEVCFAVTIGNHMIGAVALSSRILTEKDSSWLKYNYHIDELVNFDRHRLRNQSFVTFWSLDPVYSAFTRRILQQIMHQHGKSLLYYQSERDAAPPLEIANEFIPLKPRSRMQESEGLRVEFIERPSASEGGRGNDCPLFCLTKHHLSRPKDTVAKRIVIAAGSSHSYAVLETLCCVPYLNFPNIYVIMDRVPEPMRMDESLQRSHPQILEDTAVEDEYSGCLSISDEHFPLTQQLYALGLGHKVRFVRGNLTDIDRENRAVVVSNEQVIEYDVLVLSNCVQDNTTKRISTIQRMHPAKCADAGIFGIGNPVADYEAMKYVQKRYAGRSEDVVVNGSGLLMFSAVAQLIKHGIAPSRITVVIPEEEGKVKGFPEKKITEPMVKGLLSVGVKICWGFTVADVMISKSGFVESVDLQRVSANVVAAQGSIGSISNEGAAPEKINVPIVVVHCIALINCHSAVCNHDVFCAINDCGLVFDGGLVVNTSFRTVDPVIYAVSDFTRFSRVYRDALPHSRYNPREIGTYVALRMLEEQLDPRSISYSLQGTGVGVGVAELLHASTFSSISAPRESRPKLPVFTSPRAQSCVLPGGLKYFCSCIPNVPEEPVNYITDGITALKTHSQAAVRNRTTLMRTDSLGYVVQFLYIGEDQVETRNLWALPGIHESFMNGAVHAFESGIVGDWINYFREPWAAILFQDKFSLLLRTLKRTLVNDKGTAMILSRVFERAENSAEIEVSKYRRELVGPHGELAPEETKLVVEAETLEFLKQNQGALPYYQTGR